MSTRVISDRELLHNLSFEVSELRESVASLHLRLDRVSLGMELDSGRHSRRVDAAIPPRAAHLEVAGDVVSCSCGRKVVAS